MMKRIETVYCTYCKSNQQSLEKIQEISSNPQTSAFLAEAAVQLKQQTTAWDLSSMLIKPSQRVLKYPLLLKRILKEEEDWTPVAEKVKLQCFYRVD